MADITIAMVLAEVRKQLDWRGPNDKAQGIITMPRAYAEYLHRWAIDLCNAKDGMESKLERLDERIAEGIHKQRQEFDNLGDGESIVLVGKVPTINLKQLAEFIRGEA